MLKGQLLLWVCWLHEGSDCSTENSDWSDDQRSLHFRAAAGACRGSGTCASRTRSICSGETGLKSSLSACHRNTGSFYSSSSASVPCKANNNKKILLEINITIALIGANNQKRRQIFLVTYRQSWELQLFQCPRTGIGQSRTSWGQLRCGASISQQRNYQGDRSVENMWVWNDFNLNCNKYAYHLHQMIQRSMRWE